MTGCDTRTCRSVSSYANAFLLAVFEELWLAKVGVHPSDEEEQDVNSNKILKLAPRCLHLLDLVHGWNDLSFLQENLQAHRGDRKLTLMRDKIRARLSLLDREVADTNGLGLITVQVDFLHRCPRIRERMVPSFDDAVFLDNLLVLICIFDVSV